MNTSKKLLFLLPVAAGILLLLILVKTKKGPTRPELAERARAVSVVNVEPATIVPKVNGYGYVRPTETWSALPEVSGKVIEMHPELKKGAFIAEGELLVRLDPQTYDLAQTRSEASVTSIEAQLKELAQQRSNTEKLLELERQKLQLTSQELERKRKLKEKGVISISDFEAEERTMLAQQAAVDQLINSLQLLPSQEKSLRAKKDSDVSSLSERRLDLEKTIIRAPFDCRISAVNIELNQFAPAGSKILEAVNITKVEIPVQLSPASFANLISLDLGERSILEATNLEMEALRNLVGIGASVRVPLFSREAIWPATFKRTSESIDLDTGALTVYVEVDQPYQKIIPSKRPPLIPNFYAEVELQGSPRPARWVVPFQAIHDSYLHLVDADNRLRRQEVEVEMIMGDLAIISQGLSGRVQVITSDLVPAIEGMLLIPVVDEEQTAKVKAAGSATPKGE